MRSLEGASNAERLIVGISGASGIIYGVRTLELLRPLGIETHLVITRSAQITLAHEITAKIEEVRALASVVHRIDDVGATISSGSFKTMGMIIAPCSIRNVGDCERYTSYCSPARPMSCSKSGGGSYYWCAKRRCISAISGL